MSYREEMVKCPFDQTHRISRARFPLHLIKCRKQHKGKNFSICPYNATHYIITTEFQFHLDNCPDRREKELIIGEFVPEPVNQDINLPPPSESWDTEENPTVSYLDVKDSVISMLPVLRTPTGMTKSERKKFARREINRFHNIARMNNQQGGIHGDPFDHSSHSDDTVRDTGRRSGIEEPPRRQRGNDNERGFCVVKRRGHQKRGDRKR